MALSDPPTEIWATLSAGSGEEKQLLSEKSRFAGKLRRQVIFWDSLSKQLSEIW